MAYTKILFQDSPSTATPLNAQNLNHMDDGIAENDRRLNELATAGVVNTFNSRTGNVTSEKGDYDINQIVASDGQDGYIPVWRNNGTEQEPDWFFAMEEMGGSGHEILDADGTSMAQEDALQFADAFLTDDSVNGRTVVENIKEVDPADYASTTDEGIIVTDDGDDALIGPVSDDYVEVTADGEKTRAQLLTDLDALVDWSKVNENSYIVFGNDIYRVNVPNVKIFMTSAISNGHLYNTMFDLNTHISQQFDTTTSTTTLTDNSSNKPSSGRKLTLYYGNKKATVDLQTTANRCLYDNTTVKQKIDTLSAIIKKKTFTASTDANKIAETGLTTANAIPISVDCIGCTCYIGTTYSGRWLATFYDYGTGNMISVTNKEITVYYIDLSKISVQS